MDISEQDRKTLRTGIETAVRMAACGDRTETWVDVRGGMENRYFRLEVYKPDESVELPPLDATRQLALSVLLGEPVPPAVLLSALEDAGVYPNGVLQAAADAENALLDMGEPTYTAGESWMQGCLRFNEVASGWYTGQKAQVYGVCKGLWGSGHASIGNMFGNFLDPWLGRRTHRPSGETCWPTTEYLRDRMAKIPPLARVFRHLRLTAKPATAERLTALIEHLERR